MSKARGFTLIELLVVIAIIALLLALLFPVLRSAREMGHRAVCLSNLRQLTLAWIAYATEYDGKLVYGATGTIGGGGATLKGWAGTAFAPAVSQSRAELIANPDKGALWPWIKDIDVYRCPRGWKGHALTYGTVPSANGGTRVKGTFLVLPNAGDSETGYVGKRVGSTVLKLTRLTDIISPGAGQRAVFVDSGYGHLHGFFYVEYLYPTWRIDPPPVHHRDGVTLSMADGHAEYWKWKGRETVEDVPRRVVSVYEPQTEDGLYDLQRLQRATWGRLGY